MGNNWLIATPRLSQWGTLRSDYVTAGDMPLVNLTKSSEQPTDRCRFLNATAAPVSFDIDISDAMGAQGIDTWRIAGILYNNSGQDDTYRVTGAASPGGIGSPTYDSGTLPLWADSTYTPYPRVHTLLYVPGGRTESYLRFTFNISSPRRRADTASGFAPVTYFEIGQLLIAHGAMSGDGISPLTDSGIKHGSISRGQMEEARSVVAEGGPEFPRRRPSRQTKTLTMCFKSRQGGLEDSNNAVEQEYEATLGSIRREVGTSRAVLLCEDILSTTHRMSKTVYGIFGELSDVQLPQSNYYEVGVKVRELL